jgi:hypothetical protein
VVVETAVESVAVVEHLLVVAAAVAVVAYIAFERKSIFTS